MKKYKQSPIYYTGNKFKLLKTIEPLFPKNINSFYDIFGGGGTISINAEAKKIFFNDIDFTYGLMKNLLNKTPEEEVERCVQLSKKYSFPEKATWGDNTKDNERLKFKENFYKNVPKIKKDDIDEILFWQHYSFSNKIEFKSNGYYDLSCGMRLLKPKLYLKKLQNLNQIKDKITVTNYDFETLINQVVNSTYINKNDFIYLDPPYLASTRVRYAGWDEQTEKRLLKCLDLLLNKNIKFGLSNSIEVRGNKNNLLIDWIDKNKDKVRVIYPNNTYTIGAGDKTSGKKNTNIEVYITNYKGDKMKEKSQYLKDKENGKVEESRFFNNDNKVFKQKNDSKQSVENKLYFENDNVKIFQGSNLDNLKLIPDNSLDSIVCDPPYELGFMGKSWDSTGIAYSVELWKLAKQKLKHGGFLLAFSGSRTYHRMAVAIEDAGFLIKDQIMWLYGSGFPKALDISKSIDKQSGYEGKILGTKKGVGKTESMNIASNPNAYKEEYDVKELSKEAKQWEGWKTALKPAHEPIVVAQKPLEKGLNYAQNILKWGVGALNIDESRIKSEEWEVLQNSPSHNPKIRIEGNYKTSNSQESITKFDMSKNEMSEKGRFPANVIHDNSQEVKNAFPDTKSGGAIRKNYQINNDIYGDMSMLTSNQTEGFGDSGSAARFFYGTKAQTNDRDQGLENFEEKKLWTTEGQPNSFDIFESDKNGRSPRKNIHPTVKPTDLMRYLVRMVTPKNGTVADIFMGSGSTGKGAMVENILNNKNYKFIGFELTEEYLPIARDRIIKGSIEYANEEKYGKPKPKKVNDKQMKLF